MSKVYLLVEHVKHEGSEVLDVYSNKLAAENEAARRRQLERQPYDVSYEVHEREVADA